MSSLPYIGNTVSLDGEEDEDLEFGKAVLLPVAEWAATKSSYLDYEFLFFIAVEVLQSTLPLPYYVIQNHQLWLRCDLLVPKEFIPHRIYSTVLSK